jgi:hypothetical protein
MRTSGLNEKIGYIKSSATVPMMHQTLLPVRLYLLAA